MANTLPLIEVDYYNTIWNKRILTPQPVKQTGTVDVIPGGAGLAANLGTWPINNVFAPPLSFNPGFDVDGGTGTLEEVITMILCLMVLELI